MVCYIRYRSNHDLHCFFKKNCHIFLYKYATLFKLYRYPSTEFLLSINREKNCRRHQAGRKVIYEERSPHILLKVCTFLQIKGTWSSFDFSPGPFQIFLFSFLHLYQYSFRTSPYFEAWDSAVDKYVEIPASTGLG